MKGLLHLFRAKTAPKAEVARQEPAFSGKPRRRIPDGVAARASVPVVSLPRANPFTLPQHPPGVVPKGQEMAMDAGIGDMVQWAGSVGQGLYTEGLGFLGYAYLAELAQRAEYRRITETIASEMTRKWIKIKSKGDEDKSERIEKIEEALRRLNVKDAFRRVAEQDGFYGRGHLYLDFGNDDPVELTTPVGDGWNDSSTEKVAKGALKRIRPIEAIWCYPSGYNTSNPLAPDWYKPQAWFVQGRQVHASRLLTFIGREVPDILKPAYSFGGLSLSQMAKPYVDNWLRTRQSVADLIYSFSVSGIKTNLADALSVGQGEDFFKRLDLFTNLRSNRGTMALDKDEEFFNVSTPLGTLDALQAQTQEHMAAVSGIPIVKLLGIQPAGLNASSEGELEVFYTWVHANQERLFTPNLTRILGFIMLSEFGEVDPDITFEYEPLDALDEKELAELRKIDAETGKVLVESKAISPQEERHRVATDPATPYAAIDVDTPVPLNETEKATLAVGLTQAIATAVESTLVPQANGLQELQTVAKMTGIWSSVTDETISEADLEPPAPEGEMPEEGDDPMRRSLRMGKLDDPASSTAGA